MAFYRKAWVCFREVLLPWFYGTHIDALPRAGLRAQEPPRWYSLPVKLRLLKKYVANVKIRSAEKTLLVPPEKFSPGIPHSLYATLAWLSWTHRFTQTVSCYHRCWCYEVIGLLLNILLSAREVWFPGRLNRTQHRRLVMYDCHCCDVSSKLGCPGAKPRR